MADGPVHGCETPGLALGDKISCYCERGLDPALWAEPANALSNLGFIAVALLIGWRLRHDDQLAHRTILWAFVALLALIGVGSALFHTFATVWARLADVAPIGLFVFAYMALALNWFLGLSAMLAFLLAVLVTVATFLMPPWLNGSFFYAPALVMLVVIGATLLAKGHKAGKWVASAAGAFFVALVFRSFDRAPFICADQGIGTHWAWHSINALVLYLLLRAALDYAAKGKRAPAAP